MKLHFRPLDAQIASNCGFVLPWSKHKKPTVANAFWKHLQHSVVPLESEPPRTQGLQLMGMIFDSSLQKKRSDIFTVTLKSNIRIGHK